MISYKPLWITLVKEDMKKMDLVEKVGISRGTLSKLGKNESVGLDIINKICIVLECRIEEVVEILQE